MVVLEQDDRVDAAPRQPPRDGRDGARNRALHVRRDLPAGTRLTLPTSRLCLSAFRSPRPARRPPPSVLRPSPLAPPASRLPTPASRLASSPRCLRSSTCKRNVSPRRSV